MMKITLYTLTIFMLSACGYKGNLYLPKENDDARFGVIQTSIDFKHKPTTNKE